MIYAKGKDLSSAIKAYYVNLDCIVPFLIKHRYESEGKAWFCFDRAIWKKAGIQHPASGAINIFSVSPDDPQRPVIHPGVAYSVDEAIQILKNIYHKQASYYRQAAVKNIEDAEEMETANYREMVLGKGRGIYVLTEGYISPFTGKDK